MGEGCNVNCHDSINELDSALKIAARIIVLYGDNYIPVFERLNAEVLRAKEKLKTKNLAIELAKKVATAEEIG